MIAGQLPASGITGAAGCTGSCTARTRSVAVTGNGFNGTGTVMAMAPTTGIGKATVP
ncbi:MAG: hypothetical protein M1420_04115 [Actinobacteria bacterium]|jgi:hypothetical protein|nr:hypothetical protein [Actinomycetota bacterium]